MPYGRKRSTYDATARKKKRYTKRRLGSPNGVLVAHSPDAPKPYMGRGSDVKWQNRALNASDPYYLETTSLGQVYHVNSLSMGTGQNRRIGNAFRNLGVHLRGYINQGSFDQYGFTLNDTLRISLVWDASPNKMLPAYYDIYQTDGTPASPAGIALPNYPQEDRFKILWTKTTQMSRGNDSQKRWDIDEYVGFPPNLITKYVGGTTGDSINLTLTGGLYLCFGSCNTLAQGVTLMPRIALSMKYFFDEKTP